MNKHLNKMFSAITILALMLMAMPVQSALAATIISQWNFESPNPADANNVATYPNSIASAGGGGNAGGAHTSAGTDWSTPAGNGSVDSFSSNEWAVGDYYQFMVSTSNYTGIQVSWDQTRSATGPSEFKLAYSTDGTTFTDFGSPYTILANTWSSGSTSSTSSFTRDLSAITALDNQPNVYFRLINNIAPGATGGTNRVDNFTVSGSPIVVEDIAPSVSGTTPTNGATNVAIDTNIDVTFSEPVNVTGSWFSISCAPTSGTHTATVTGGPTTFTLNPDTDFANGETCTVTVVASLVTDQDATDPPDNMAADYVFGFSTVGAATAAALVINEIDYDQPTPPTNDSAEFVEIKNTETSAVNLDSYSLVFVNGSGGATYDTIDLPNVSLAAGDYYVVCANTATVANCDLDDGPDTNFIQNGAPDAVALLFGASIVDAVSYEGNTVAPYTEGSGVGLEDTAAAAESISRCQDGSDTDVNNVDFLLRGITPGAANNCPAPPPPPGVCFDPATFIHDIQGSGLASPLANTTVVIEGVVIGDYQPSPSSFGGFHIQEEDLQADADPLTSEGIFVFDNLFGVDVNVGDVVRVRGTVGESANLTRLSSVDSVQICSSGNSVSASSVTLPVSSLNDWEAYEGMLISIAQDLTATENFSLGRFGEVALSVNGRLLNPTMITTPGPAAIAQQDLNNRSRILLDDGDNQQNLDPTVYPTGGLSALDTLRSGDTVNGLSGVLEQRFGVYRVQPIGPVSFNPTNPRPTAPDPVGGTLRVAAMNVLNYFTTLDTNPGSNNGPNICGPSATLECRGANTALEFTRQRDKIISAILGLNADIIGLMEMENNETTAIQDLVDGLNAATAPGTYAFIDTGTIGTDAIKVGLLYKPAKVTPIGAHAILDSSVDPSFIDTLNRPVLAQTFEELATGATLTVAVNHLKSKGSACAGDADAGDGQGNCNITRRNAAIAEANWLATDPTGSGDPDFLLIGDFNAYLMEDPITALQDLGYTDLIDALVNEDAYSYVFEGQSGYLDHALSSSSLTAQVTDATEWHVNADEPTVLDYNTDFKSANHVNTLYAPDAYRSSDHDPLIVGLGLAANTTCNGLPATIVGTIGNDVINGTSGHDVIVGLGGNDIINGGNGDDVICGGAGNDTLNGGNANDTIIGGYGNDTLDGGNGNDNLSGDNGTDNLKGDNGNDVLDGGNDDDVLDGGNGNDSLSGGDGVDTLKGDNGDDILSGGNGNDSLTGANGNDTLNGGADNDALVGNNGTDSLTGGTGADSFSGGQGSDTNIDFSAGDGDTSDGT